MTIETTLNKIREHSPCQDAWGKLLKSLGRTQADDEPLAFSRIIESNGLDDALWCLRSICPEHESQVRLFAADCAESVLHFFEKQHPDDNRPRLAIKAARAFANGEISMEQLSAASAAARDAVLTATSYAALTAASYAVWATARSTASAAAMTARTAQATMIKDRFS